MTEIWDQLYDVFATIPDPHVDRTKAHSLIDIISIAICAVICGADSWVAVEPLAPSSALGSNAIWCFPSYSPENSGSLGCRLRAGIGWL